MLHLSPLLFSVTHYHLTYYILLCLLSNSLIRVSFMRSEIRLFCSLLYCYCLEQFKKMFAETKHGKGKKSPEKSNKKKEKRTR